MFGADGTFCLPKIPLARAIKRVSVNIPQPQKKFSKKNTPYRTFLNPKRYLLLYLNLIARGIPNKT
jgi:hypothetical protein